MQQTVSCRDGIVSETCTGNSNSASGTESAGFFDSTPGSAGAQDRAVVRICSANCSSARPLRCEVVSLSSASSFMCVVFSGHHENPLR